MMESSHLTSVHNHMFLIVIDAYSKWIEANPMSFITSSTTISHLHQIIVQYGLPEVVVTDNG